MDEADAFSRYAQSLNAIAFVPDFEKPDEQAFAASLDSFQAFIDGSANLIVPGYIEKMTPNAFADHVGGVHYITMHQTLLVTMMDFALYAFTQSAFLPIIGDAAGEESPPPASGEAPGLFLLDRTLAGGIIDASKDRHRVPKDAERHVMAVYMAMLMTRFVWLHELAHCQRGHVLVLQQRGLGARLYEVPEPLEAVGFHRRTPGSPDAIHMRHAMELEADADALRDCLRIQFEGLEKLPGIAAMDLPLRLALTIISAYLMTWLFEEYQRHMDTADNAAHPMARDRLQQLVVMVDADYGRTIDGFDDLHAEIKGQFNVLAKALPAMPTLSNE